jgi:hypothetical protein
MKWTSFVRIQHCREISCCWTKKGHSVACADPMHNPDTLCYKSMHFALATTLEIWLLFSTMTTHFLITQMIVCSCSILVDKHVFILALLRTKEIFTASLMSDSFPVGGDPWQTQQCSISLRAMSRNSDSGTIRPFQSWTGGCIQWKCRKSSLLTSNYFWGRPTQSVGTYATGSGMRYPLVSSST